MPKGIRNSSRLQNWLANIRKIVGGRQRWSADSEFSYYAVDRRVVEEHRSRQDAFAAECWYSGMQIMRGMGILDTKRVGGARVLDIGAGECLLAGAMSRCGAAEVWAVDAVPKQIWAAAEKLSALGRMSFVVASVTDLPFGDSSFDLVTANLVLHHIEPVESVAAEVFRCLRPGGQFIAAEPSPLVGALGHGDGSDNEAPIPPARLAADLERAGFADVKARYLWVRLATSALGPLSPSYVVSGRKPGSSGGATVTLRRPLAPMHLQGLQIDSACPFQELARRQEAEILQFAGDPGTAASASRVRD